MTLTVTVRLPRAVPAHATGRAVIGALLPIAEPAVLLLAEAAGAGLVGQIVCATALRSARQALAAAPEPAAPAARPCCRPALAA